MAKLEVKIYDRIIPKEDLIEDLRRVARKLKKDFVTMYEYHRLGRYSASTLQKRIGSWTEALRRAGLKQAKARFVTDRQLFENMKRMWKRLGRQPKNYEVRSPLSEYCIRPYERRFGTWINAVKWFVKVTNSGGVKSAELKEESVPANHKSGRTVRPAMRLTVLKRDNFKCRLCGASPATEAAVSLVIDHIKPWCEGGETELDNLQTLCSKCNAGKGNYEV